MSLSERGGARPFISIIVPTCNSAAHLPGALSSLASQLWRDFEVVISDGGSHDATLELVRLSSSSLPALRLLSRPDEGVYDAINLGIAAASGEWVLVLGCDDRLHAADTLLQAHAYLRASRADVVYGDVQVMAANRMNATAGERYCGPAPLPRLMRMNICQQAIFYRRALFRTLGPFRLDYPVLSDWEFNLRAASTKPMQWIDLVVANYAADGLSSRSRDRAAERDIPELVRRILLQRAGDPATSSAHRLLLRQADQLRRRGHWRLALGQLGSYAWLVVRRALRLGGDD